MSPFSKLHCILRANASMAGHTSLRVGGTVAWLAEPETIEQFSLVHRVATEAGYRIFILGRGSNVLVADGHHRAWVVISTLKLDRTRRSGHHVHCDAGVGLPRLVALAEHWGLGGLERLAGIPGTVGGAVAMNAGGHAGTIGDRLVRALVAYPGEPPREMCADELALGYRTSILRGGTPCLLGATFQLDTAATPSLARARRDLLARRNATQPMGARSAGCIFRNPPHGRPAGLLIDRAGLKGAAVGGAQVSHVHANFIINRGRASATDVFDLIDLVVQRVHHTFGVWLEPEVELWRDDAQQKEQPWPSRRKRAWQSSMAAAPRSAASRSRPAPPSARPSPTPATASP